MRESLGYPAAVSRLTYRRSGVDIGAADRLVEQIKRIAATTRTPAVVSGVGLFAAALRLPRNLVDPILLTATDGVGTKLALARMLGRHDTIGIDLVAMNVNDLLTTGARPLCFLDYLAVGRLATVPALDVLRGIAIGCRDAGASLVGGETAEMPGFYRDGEYDLAGFAVGIAERRGLIDGSRVRPGDVVIGLTSSGLHSNGYSLARRALRATSRRRLDRRVPELGETLGDALLRPTRIYVRPVLAALKQFRVHGMAHITGGGLPGNLVRVLPRACGVEINRGTLPVSPLFDVIMREGRIARAEMDRTFNCGIGYTMIVAPGDTGELLGFLKRQGLDAVSIGRVRRGRRAVSYVGRRPGGEPSK
jgi:phosphoribosylformylglycinamidine cyclo-ligase